MVITTDVHATNFVHTVFLPSDKSLNPFSDPFIQRVVNMNRNKLYTIRPMDDDEFLLKLIHNDDTLGGELHGKILPFRKIFFLFENI